MPKKTILIVDDTDWNRDLLVQLLEEDYHVVEATDGAEGVKRTEEGHPDLILMDLGMPVMDGWEATRRIKANDALKQIPIIAVTSHAMVGDEIDARPDEVGVVVHHALEPVGELAAVGAGVLVLRGAERAAQEPPRIRLQAGHAQPHQPA